MNRVQWQKLNRAYRVLIGTSHEENDNYGKALKLPKCVQTRAYACENSLYAFSSECKTALRHVSEGWTSKQEALYCLKGVMRSNYSQARAKKPTLSSGGFSIATWNPNYSKFLAWKEKYYE